MRTEKNCEVKYDFWAFYPADDQTERKFLSLISACPSPEQRVFSDEHINTLIGIAISENNEFSAYSEEILACVYRQILCYILRDFDGGQRKSFLGSSVAQSQCFRAMSYVDSHLCSLTSLSEVSQALGYNYSYFSRLFRKITGVTLSEYYGMRRLDTARFLLEEGGDVLHTDRGKASVLFRICIQQGIQKQVRIFAKALCRRVPRERKENIEKRI